jgi:hypothetical protein
MVLQYKQLSFRVKEGNVALDTKSQILSNLENIYNLWQKLLARLSYEQIATPLQPSPWTVKDIVAHLWFWQQASVARAEAALQDKDPQYPEWWELFGPNPEEDVDRTNAWNYEHSKDKPWQQVYTDWLTQFSHYLDLLRQIPERDLIEAGRYQWMGNYPLSASAMGSYDHHQEHLETLTAWLDQHDRTS